jgi:hypothetical protein
MTTSDESARAGSAGRVAHHFFSISTGLAGRPVIAVPYAMKGFNNG